VILFVKVRKNDFWRQSRICMTSFRIILLKFVCVVYIVRIPTKRRSRAKPAIRAVRHVLHYHRLYWHCFGVLHTAYAQNN
jgi:hypothetical protein